MFLDEKKDQEWSEYAGDPAAIMEQFRSARKKAGFEYITFNRMHRSLLQQLMKIYKNPELDIQKSPEINFEGEMAADAGGPKKEYFYSAIESLFKVDPIFGIALFTGERGHYISSYEHGCHLKWMLQDGWKTAGTQCLAWWPRPSRPCTCSFIDAADLVSVTDIADIDLRCLIKEKVHNQCCFYIYTLFRQD